MVLGQCSCASLESCTCSKQIVFSLRGIATSFMEFHLEFSVKLENTAWIFLFKWRVNWRGSTFLNRCWQQIIPSTFCFVTNIVENVEIHSTCIWISPNDLFARNSHCIFFMEIFFYNFLPILNLIWGLGSSRPINVKRRRNKFELSEIDQVVLRLEDIEHGNAIIKRDTRRCHIAIIDDSELMKCKSALAQTQTDLQAASDNLLQAQADIAAAAENTASAGNDNQLLKDENADLLAQLASLKSQLNLVSDSKLSVGW